jgi:hypothetical protein
VSKVEVTSFTACWKKRDEPPLWFAIAEFGAGVTAEIPLPAHFVPGDDSHTQRAEAIEAMESLAEALQRFAKKCRNSRSNDQA